MSPPRGVCLMGPTAAGKSALAFDLAEALERQGRTVEIISVDSAQVYRGMDIGTAKPSQAEQTRFRHHLIDLCEPEDAYSAARFASDAEATIEDILSRGHLPLLVGGTMLYFRALLQGLNDMPSADPELRQALASRGEALGWPALHAELKAIDPETAARLHPNDSQRIQRALEVHALSGMPLSRLIAKQGTRRRGNYLRLALLPEDRAWLHGRIDARLGAMFEAGLVEEVRRLRARPGLSATMPSMRSVGYRQVWAHLDGEMSLEAARQQALEATRQMAKRQITWLRSEKELCVLGVGTDLACDGVGASNPCHVAVLTAHHVEKWLQESS